MKFPTAVMGAWLVGAVAACTTQEGALIHVTFEAGSLDHVEFIFARAASSVKIDVRPRLLVDDVTPQRAHLRDYSAADSVAIAANATAYDYLVPSNVAPAAEALFVVGYLNNEPRQIAFLTPRVPSDHVNRYTAALVADDRNLKAFGIDPFNCVAWRHDDLVDAITLADDHDCDGRATRDEPTCDVRVLDPAAPPVETCDSFDSNSDCVLPPEDNGICAKAGSGACVLAHYNCKETLETVAFSCAGPPPPSSRNINSDICIDPRLCGDPAGEKIDLAAAPPSFVCTVAFAAPADQQSCNQFQLKSPPINAVCPDADFFDDGSVKIQRNTSQGGCSYLGKVEKRLPGELGKKIGVLYPINGMADGTRRLTVVELVYADAPAKCGAEPSLSCVPQTGVSSLLQTCGL